MGGSRKSWNTDDEINFLKEMDKSGKKSRHKYSRLEKLIIYREANTKRVRWGDINPLEVYKITDSEIIKEKKLSEGSKKKGSKK